MGYLNTIELKTKKVSKNWLPIIPILRDELNKIREVEVPKDIMTLEYPIFNNVNSLNKNIM